MTDGEVYGLQDASVKPMVHVYITKKQSEQAHKAHRHQVLLGEIQGEGP